jgi:hypothetical protein
MEFVLSSNPESLVRSRKSAFPGISVHTGIKFFNNLKRSWTPFFNGVTSFYDFINPVIPYASKATKH